MLDEFMMRLMLAYFTRRPIMFFYPELVELAIRTAKRFRYEFKDEE